MAATDLPIVLYGYPESPYARRIAWYLTLRKIPYSQCLQPRILPRPDLTTLLGISYRRIPLLAIGRSVYLDTRLMLRKLETLFPPSAAHPGISSTEPEHRAMERLLARQATETGLFSAAAQCLPAELLNDQAFLNDRADLVGVDMSAPGAVSPFSPAAMRTLRPEALCVVRDAVALLEETLLGDGRAWVLRTEGPSLADLEAVWLLHWLRGIPGALPEEVVGRAEFPRVLEWVDRFDAFVKEREREVGVPRAVDGEEAAGMVVRAAFPEGEGDVDVRDPVVVAEGLRKGAGVLVFPSDYGSTYKDMGALVSMDAGEVVIKVNGKLGSVRVHAPRQGFKVKRDGGSGATSQL